MALAVNTCNFMFSAASAQEIATALTEASGTATCFETVDVTINAQTCSQTLNACTLTAG